jgi:hypothetical protein
MSMVGCGAKQAQGLVGHGQAAESVDNPAHPSLFKDSPIAMRTLRIALIWMLMLALPAQSMAAIGMQLCALTQGTTGSASSQQMAAHHPAVVAPQTMQASAHGEHHKGDSPSAMQTSDNSLCSLCAFCVGAVALSSVVAGNSLPHAVEPSLARLERFIGFIAETPERPPRRFLAEAKPRFYSPAAVVAEAGVKRI